MLNLFTGIIIGFFCGTMTGIIMMCIAASAKENDEIIKNNYKKEEKNKHESND